MFVFAFVFVCLFIFVFEFVFIFVLYESELYLRQLERRWCNFPGELSSSKELSHCPELTQIVDLLTKRNLQHEMLAVTEECMLGSCIGL